MVMAAASKSGNPKTSGGFNAMPPMSEEAPSAEPAVSAGVAGDEKPTSVAEMSSDVLETEAETDTQKKMKRAERFGVAVHLSEEEKRNSRAERFGTGSTADASHTLQQSEDSKRKARAQRFGALKATPVDDEAKKKARVERFRPSAAVDAAEEDKKKARALRFSTGAKENGREIIESTAVAGKVMGGA